MLEGQPRVEPDDDGIEQRGEIGVGGVRAQDLEEPDGSEDLQDGRDGDEKAPALE